MNRNSAIPRLEHLEERSLPSSVSHAAMPHFGAPMGWSTKDILVRFHTGPGSTAPVALPGTTLGPALDANGLYRVFLNAGETVHNALVAYHHDAQVIYAIADLMLIH